MVLKFRIGICLLHKPVPKICCAHYNFVVHITISECSAGTSNIFAQCKVSSLEHSCFEMLAGTGYYGGLICSYKFGRKHQILSEIQIRQLLNKRTELHHAQPQHSSYHRHATILPL
jgi:hypothetical protein